MSAEREAAPICPPGQSITRPKPFGIHEGLGKHINYKKLHTVVAYLCRRDGSLLEMWRIGS